MNQVSENAGPIYSNLALDEDLRDIVVLFVEEMPDRITKIESQFQSADWHALERTVHQLKGAAGSYGFPKLSPAAAVVEDLIKADASAAEIGKEVANLVSLCRLVTADPPFTP